MPKIEAILAENPDKDTLQMAKIPANFRDHDLPILLELEDQYWEDDAHLDIDKKLINSLSTVGKQLFSFLTGVDYD